MLAQSRQFVFFQALCVLVLIVMVPFLLREHRTEVWPRQPKDSPREPGPPVAHDGFTPLTPKEISQKGLSIAPRNRLQDWYLTDFSRQYNFYGEASAKPNEFQYGSPNGNGNGSIGKWFADGESDGYKVIRIEMREQNAQTGWFCDQLETRWVCKFGKKNIPTMTGGVVIATVLRLESLDGNSPIDLVRTSLE